MFSISDKKSGGGAIRIVDIIRVKTEGEIFMKRRVSLFFAVVLCVSNSLANLVFYDRNAGIELIGTSTMTVYSDKLPPINGTILREPTATIAGQKFYFNEGMYSDGFFEVVLTATYDSSTSYSIYMLGKAPYAASSRFYVISPGLIRNSIQLDGTANTIQGLPTFGVPNAVKLNKASAAVTMAIQSELNQNMIMSGGTLNLGDNLGLGDSVLLTGSGTINFNTFNLSTGQKALTWTDTLLFVNAKNLILGADSTLYGQWIFKGDALILGNNNEIDLSHGATIWIKKNTTVTMFDTIIGGLGKGSIIFEDQTSKLDFYNVNIDMERRDYTFTNGSIYVEGPVLVNVGPYLMRFDQNASLTVDNTTMYYNPLDYNDINNIRFGTNYETLNPKYVTYFRGGSVRKGDNLKVGPHKIVVDKLLDRDFAISALRPIIVNADPTIDGDGFSYQFALNPTVALVTIDPNQLLKYKNIWLKNFPVQAPGLVMNTGSQLVFGDLTTLEIGQNCTLSTTFYFEGNTILTGKNKILEMAAGGSLVLRPGASLLIDNLTIRGISQGQIYCMDNKCTLSLGDVVWEQDGDYTFTQGSILVNGLWEMKGTSTFGFQTDKTCYVTRFGRIYMDTGMTFSYAPPTNNRDLIEFENFHSTFLLSGATLMSTMTGIRITVGSFIIDDHSYLQQNTSEAVALSEGIEIGDNILADNPVVTILPGGIIEVLSGNLVDSTV